MIAPTISYREEDSRCSQRQAAEAVIVPNARVISRKYASVVITQGSDKMVSMHNMLS